jgi:hypothetical protein
LLVALGGLWAHEALTGDHGPSCISRALDRAWAVAMALGGLPLAVGLSGMLDLVLYRVSFPLVPVSLGLIAYGARLRARSGGRAAPSPLRGPRLALLGSSWS